MLATIVDWGPLGKSVLYSLVGGVGITVAFAVAIAGFTRSYELGRERRRGAAAFFLALALVAIAISLAAIAIGVYYTTQKS